MAERKERPDGQGADPTVIESPGGLLAHSHALTDRQAEAMAADLFRSVEASRQEEDEDSDPEQLSE